MCCDLSSQPDDDGEPALKKPDGPAESTARSACWSGLLERCDTCGVEPGELPSQAYLAGLRKAPTRRR